MSQYVRFCKNCNKADKEHKKIVRGRYSTFLKEDDYTCEVCGNTVLDLSMRSEDYNIIVKISNNPKFVKSMIDLAETDIIEYQSCMSNFRNQIQQQKIEQQQTNNQVKCLYCNSTNIKKITTSSKVANTALWGLFGTKRHKNYHCNQCKSNF